MAELARYSENGIDNDNESQLSATSSNQCSHVQRLRKRFECLAREQELEFHSECNWWLGGEEDIDNTELSGETVEVRNLNILRLDISRQSDSSRQSADSATYKASQKDVNLVVMPATPTQSSKSPEKYASVLLVDYQSEGATNDYDDDSFDSDNGDDSLDEHEQLRPANKFSRLSRPISITSQTSK